MHRGGRLRRGLFGLAAATGLVSLAWAAAAQTTWQAIGPKPIANAKANPVYSRISDKFPEPTQAIGAVALDSSTSPPTIYVGTN